MNTSFGRALKVLVAALTGSICTLTPSVSHAQWPDIREAKAIAEEGFIYGLPIVMNYAVMYEYSVDWNSGQPIQGAVQSDQKRGACRIPTRTRLS